MPALLHESCALTLALVFATAALGKFQAFAAWTGIVQNFRVLPRALAAPFAWLLPPLEAAVAVALLVDAVRPIAAAAAALLLALFAAAIAQNLRRGRTLIDCGCFSAELRQPLSPALLVRNAALCAMALALLPAAVAADGLSLMGYAIAAGAALCLFFCYLSVGLLFRPVPRVLPA